MKLQAETRKTVLYMAPLQGYTDAAYREAFQQCFGTVDVCIAPYVSLGKQLRIEGLTDLMVRDPFRQNLVPQVLAGSVQELSILLESIAGLGYSEINLNMGCPYPMVTGKGRGAALIRKPELVRQMIDLVHDEMGFKLSIKLRTGLEREDEANHLLNKLPLEKLETLIIHPRTALQLYRGQANTGMAAQCVQAFPGKCWVYNGDISSYNDYVVKKELLPDVQQWMLGRGLLQNPFLPGLIKNQSEGLPADWGPKLLHFMDTLLAVLIRDSHDEGHALNRARIQLTYLLNGFPEFKKERKQMHKSRSLKDLAFAIKIIESKIGIS